MRTEKYLSEPFLGWIPEVLDQWEDHLMTDVAEKDSRNSLEETGGVACEPIDRSILQVKNSMIDDFIFV